MTNTVDFGNYLSIEDILATQTRLPCKYEVQVMRLGYLDPSSGSAHITVGAKQELPFWLARHLGTRSRKIVSIDMPNIYKQGYRDILVADANIVDLHKNGPYFYGFGLHLLELPHPEVHDVAQIVIETFKSRFRKIMDSSQNAFNENMTQLTLRLDELERELFQSGQKCLMDLQKWQNCQADTLMASSIVLKNRKRKRLEGDDLE